MKILIIILYVEYTRLKSYLIFFSFPTEFDHKSFSIFTQSDAFMYVWAQGKVSESLTDFPIFTYLYYSETGTTAPLYFSRMKSWISLE